MKNNVSQPAVWEQNQEDVSMSQSLIADAIRNILTAIGEDPDREGLLETPNRVARSYAEIFSGMSEDPAQLLGTSFDLGHFDLVVVKDIPLFSTCEHHLVPFYGKAHIAYLPGPQGKVTGLSKLARLVDLYAHRPQVQERLTTQISDALIKHLDAAGTMVVVECEHLCMAMRGIKKPGAKTVTLVARGELDTPTSRSETLTLIKAI